jgi:acyl carrier protein
MNDYLEKIIKIASEVFGVPSESLNANSTWLEDLHIDVINSLQDRNFVDFKNRLEDEFEIDIPNMKFGKTKNIAEITKFIADLCEE